MTWKSSNNRPLLQSFLKRPISQFCRAQGGGKRALKRGQGKKGTDVSDRECRLFSIVRCLPVSKFYCSDFAKKETCNMRHFYLFILFNLCLRNEHQQINPPPTTCKCLERCCMKHVLPESIRARIFLPPESTSGHKEQSYVWNRYALVRCFRSFRWDTVQPESGWQWGWRTITWRSFMSPNLTSTSSTCTRAACSHSDLPTAVRNSKSTPITEFTSYNATIFLSSFKNI